MRRVHHWHRPRRIARSLAVILYILLAVSFLLSRSPTLVGCSKYNALIIFSRCSGPLSFASEPLLNLWLYLTVFQGLAIQSLINLKDIPGALLLLGTGAVCWGLLLFLLFEIGGTIVARLSSLFAGR